MTEEKVIDKVAKLLRKAEGTTNEDEASAFMAKAQELMLRHAIDESQLRTHGERPAKVPTLKSIDFGKNVKGIKANRALFAGIADINRCRVWMNPGRRILTIAGFADDIEFVERLYASINTQMKVACSQALQFDPAAMLVNANTFSTNYFYGYVSRVLERLRAAQREAEATVASYSKEPGNAVALIDQKEAVERLVPSSLRKGPSARHKANHDAQAAGRRDGGNASLSHGEVGGASRRALNG